MRNNEDEKSKPIFREYLKDILDIKDLAPQWTVSSVLNRQYAESLPLNKRFLSDIGELREKFNVPTFKEGDDVSDWYGYELLEINEKGTVVDDSRQRAFNEAILNILKDYQLPINFLNWVTDWVFGNKKPEWKPLYNYVAFEDLEEQATARLPLITQEIRWLKKYWRDFEKKVLKNKHLPENYKKITRALDQSKNCRRRLRNLGKDLKIISEMAKRQYKDKELAEGAYADIMKKKGFTDEELIRQTREQQRLYGESSVEIRKIGKYTSRHIEAKYARKKVKKSKGAYMRKRAERFNKRFQKPVN